MTRRVLIADQTATDRIALKAILAAARYQVVAVPSAAEARHEVRAGNADIVIVDAGLADFATSGLAADMAAGGAATPPFIVITGRDSSALRTGWFDAGAAAVLTRPLDKAWILSNIRALLRAYGARAEIARQVGTARRLGFAEAAGEFRRPRRVALVGASRASVGRIMQGLSNHLDCRIEARTPTEVLDPALTGPPADLHVIAADEDPDEALWLLAELRTHHASRRAAILMEFDEADRAAGIRALDQGANALLRRDASPAERALIIARELDAKVEADEMRTQLDRSLAMAAQDHLTGLFNRRYAMQHLADLSTLRRGEGRGYGVVLIDVDHFKAVNDRLGHAAGDAALRVVASRLQSNLRDHDMVARFGGEEFLVALTDTCPEEALQAAERLRIALSADPVEAGGERLAITVSAGIACSATLTPEQTIAAADAALYRAKSNGRNRCEPTRPEDFGKPVFGAPGSRKIAG